MPLASKTYTRHSEDGKLRPPGSWDLDYTLAEIALIEKAANNHVDLKDADREQLLKLSVPSAHAPIQRPSTGRASMETTKGQNPCRETGLDGSGGRSSVCCHAVILEAHRSGFIVYKTAGLRPVIDELIAAEKQKSDEKGFPPICDIIDDRGAIFPKAWVYDSNWSPPADGDGVCDADGYEGRLRIKGLWLEQTDKPEPYQFPGSDMKSND
ncbi:hypothetical protein TruAng_005606 [Truncatella angustata]|nr:hypothetical protein TruAng_005606 [Truncatella angustata]